MINRWFFAVLVAVLMLCGTAHGQTPELRAHAPSMRLIDHIRSEFLKRQTRPDLVRDDLAMNWFRGGSTAAVINPTITGVSLSNSTFTSGSSGATVGTISVTMNFGSFAGSLTLTGTDAASFIIVGDTLKTAGALSAGTKSLNIVATQSGATGSPYTLAISPVGSAAVVSLNSVSLSNSTFDSTVANATVGTISVSTTNGAFSGSLSLTGTNAASFQIVGTTLKTNGTTAAGSYSLNIVATQGGATGSPRTLAITPVGSAPGGGGGGGGGVVASCSGSGTAYYVSNSGSDSNNGTSSSTPWQTTAKVMASTFAANACINFNGGQNFTVGGRVNGAACFYLDQTNVPSGGPIVIKSYGTGNASILSNSTCASQPGNQGTNLSALVQMNGIAMTWDGINLLANGTNTAVGFVLTNDYGPNGGAFTFQNSTVLGMQKAVADTVGDNQHSLWTNAGYKFASLNILNNRIAGCCGAGSTASNTEEAIVISGEMDYYNVEGNLVENIEGRPLPIHDTGGMIGVVSTPTNRSYVRHNLIRYSGANVNACGGMSGIEIVGGGGNVIVEYNEVHHMRSLNHGYGCDADAIDFDGDSKNAIAQYNYSHDNQGVGYLAWIGGDWGPNVYRYNISENDGGGFQTSSGSTGSERLDVYNNTFYTTTFGGTDVQQASSPLSFGASPMPIGIIANNIVGMVNNGGTVKFIDCFSNNLTGSSLQMKNNAYYNISGTGTFQVLSCSGTYTSLAAWQAAVPGGETGAFTTSSVGFQGPIPRSAECNSTPGNHLGPQPCPAGYKLTPSSSAYIGTGLNLTNSPFSRSVGSNDYYLGAIPNGVGTGYNIGADGAAH